MRMDESRYQLHAFSRDYAEVRDLHDAQRVVYAAEPWRCESWIRDQDQERETSEILARKRQARRRSSRV